MEEGIKSVLFLTLTKISSILILLTLFKTYSRYLSIDNPFAFAVWIIENNTPDACAPFSVLENKKFFLAITKGFTDLSASIHKRFPSNNLHLILL